MTEHEREVAEHERELAEEGRVEAEADRVDAEAGEGGALLEHSRVEAEAGRVAAEHARERSMKRMYARIATLIALPLALIALIPSLVGLYTLHQHADQLEQEIADRCNEGRVNREAIRSTVTDGLPALGYRFDVETGRIVRYGAPIDYYATHPEELEDALARASAALERFHPINCP